MKQNGGWHNLLGFRLPEELHADRPYWNYCRFRVEYQPPPPTPPPPPLPTHTHTPTKYSVRITLFVLKKESRVSVSLRHLSRKCFWSSGSSLHKIQVGFTLYWLNFDRFDCSTYVPVISLILLSAFFIAIRLQLAFLCPAIKSGEILFYTVRNFECSSVRQHFIILCPLHNSETVCDIFTKLHTNVKHHKTMCRTHEP